MRVIANVHIEPGNAVDRANARLLTASPDLLAALKETLAIARRNEAGGYIDRAEASIRKAEGDAT